MHGTKNLSGWLCFILALTFTQFVEAQSPPGTDIWLADLNLSSTPAVSNMHNLTNRDSYDNQPYFLPSGALLYTSERKTEGDSQTDVMFFHHTDEKHFVINPSTESEYSPTLMPAPLNYSVIRVNNQGQQHLWAYPLTEKSTLPATGKNLLPNLEPVGYHAWINDTEVLAFVLDKPHRLVRANINTGAVDTLDRDIGASLFRVPGKPAMSYTKRYDTQHANRWALMSLNIVSNERTELVKLPDDAYYYTWTQDGKVLTAVQGNIMMWDSHGAEKSWKMISDITDSCPAGASRLATNLEATRIAIVCNRVVSD